MRLNGWQRLGIIASALWVIVAGFWAYTSELDLLVQYGDPIHWSFVVGMAFAPLPFAWGSAFLILRLVRWVRQGFEETD